MIQLRPNSNRCNNHDNTRWAEFSSLKALQCIVSNVYCKTKKSPLSTTFALNLPFRVWSCITGVRKGEYTRLGFDVLALSVLLLPHGGYAAIAVDIFSELAHLQPEISNIFSNKNSKNDCSNPANSLEFFGYSRLEKDYSNPITALEFFELSEEDVTDINNLKNAYTKIKEKLEKNLKKLGNTGPIANEIQRMHNDATTAYNTLIEKYHTQISL